MVAFAEKTSINFGTKAETLEALKPLLKTGKVLPLFYFDVAAWRHSKEQCLKKIQQLAWHQQPLIVRSSAKTEDTFSTSNAGCYKSINDIKSQQALIHAVEEVILSYGKDVQPKDQVLIQPVLKNITLSGVAFTADPETTSPYFIIDFDDITNLSDTITSGSGEHIKQYIYHHLSPIQPPAKLKKVILLLQELNEIFNPHSLDIEFAINKNHELYVFQARPLILKKQQKMTLRKHAEFIKETESFISRMIKPHPYLYGQKTIFGVMPDWNPAEIIGIRPRALALSLYRELITDSVWAYQRDNYGYLNLRSFPLMVELGGLPYIDVRVSLNSFLPQNLAPNICEKLVDYYLDRLTKDPSLHDKIEFEIVFSCYTLDITNHLKILLNYGFTQLECDQIKLALIKLTNSIIHNDDGYWRQDLKKTKQLIERQKKILSSNLFPIVKLYWLIEDCKRYGTLPFAGLARAGFIAVQILKSIVSVGVMTADELSDFLASINTVTSELQQDIAALSKKDFINRYGHLRPGTYDILSPSYQKNFDAYFKNFTPQAEKTEKRTFKLSVHQLRQIQQRLNEDGIVIDVLSLLEFIKEAIEAREYAKFIFTKSVSEFLELLVDYSAPFGISREQCANIKLSDLLSLYSSNEQPQSVLERSIRYETERFEKTKLINLPPLITNPKQVWSYELKSNKGNFITHTSIMADIVSINEPVDRFNGAILMIPSADPGYDWIFTKNIAGLITQYGGANSHMAIRAGELNIPAVIGAGKVLYERWRKAKRVLLDCLNQQVKVIC